MDNKQPHPSKDKRSIKNDRKDRHADTKKNTSKGVFRTDLDWTSQLADEWEISENSMLIPEVTEPNYLSIQEMDSIIDETVKDIPHQDQEKRSPESFIEKNKLRLQEELSKTHPPHNHYRSKPNKSISEVKKDSEEDKDENKKEKRFSNTTSRKAAENLITSLTESISGTKTPKVETKMEFQSTEQVKENRSRMDQNLVPSETADFPTSKNPFKHATNNALLDIAKSESTSLATLLWLSENTDSTIRRAVASNKLSSKQILARLIKDYDGQVRLAALDNPSLTPDLVVDLLSDTNPLVSLRAYEVLNEIRKKSGLKPITNKSQVNTVNDLPAIKPKSTNKSTTPEKPTTASSTEEVLEFLRMIARKHSTPSQRLSELASHRDTQVRAAVAQNAKSPIDVLWSLLYDSERDVKRNLIKNECSPVELLWALKDDPDKLVSQEAYKELKKLEMGQ